MSLEPSISFPLAALEYGSIRLNLAASSSSLAAPLTLCRACGISCLKMESSVLEVISWPTWKDINDRWSVRPHCLLLSTVSWLWLWGINFGCTKLGSFLPKDDPVERMFMYFLKWRNADWLAYGLSQFFSTLISLISVEVGINVEGVKKLSNY